MKTLRIGIVGCGRIAHRHLDAYHAQRGAKVVSVFDIDPARAESFAREAGGARVAASAPDMAESDRLDAVSICTPPALHLDACGPFLDRRIPLLCEKPLEVDERRARRLAQRVEESATIVMTAFCHRFHPPIVELRRLIKSGTLGEPLLFRNIFAGGILALQGDHRAERAVSGGGSVIDHCSHSVDLFRFLAGEPTHVQAMAGNILQKAAVEDFNMIHLRRGRDLFGEITASYSLPVCESHIEWHGTKGTAFVHYNRGPDLEYSLDGLSWKKVNCGRHPEPFKGQIRHFLTCVRTGRRPSVSVDDGLKANRIVAAAYRSIAEERCVRIRL